MYEYLSLQITYLSNTTTSHPAFKAWTQMWLPMYPAPPVTRMRLPLTFSVHWENCLSMFASLRWNSFYIFSTYFTAKLLTCVYPKQFFWMTLTSNLQNFWPSTSNFSVLSRFILKLQKRFHFWHLWFHFNDFRTKIRVLLEVFQIFKFSDFQTPLQFSLFTVFSLSMAFLFGCSPSYRYHMYTLVYLPVSPLLR